MAKLYEMTQQTQALYEMLCSGEIDEQTFSDTVEGIGAIEKVEGYCQVINQLSADSAVFGAEIDRLSKRKKAIDNSIMRLKNNLQYFYEANGSKPIEAGTFRVTVRNSEYVYIPDLDRLPKKYFKVKKEADKSAIRQAIKDGHTVRGAEILTRGSVQIK